MIMVILLILTVVFLAVGAVSGFNRGIIKQGVRVALWGVLFLVSCFFIPQITDRMLLFVAEKIGYTAPDVEQLIAGLLAEIELMDVKNYLLLPAGGFVRTLAMPVVTILCFWASGQVSWILYLIASVFLRKATENQGILSQLAGMLLAVAVALFCGAMTVYPVAQISSSLNEGNLSQNIAKDFPIAESLETAYEGTVVQKVYQYTGMESASDFVHTKINNQAVLEEYHNIWTELPGIVRLTSAGYDIYCALISDDLAAMTLQPLVNDVANAVFDVNFIADEQKLALLNCAKETVEASVNNEMISVLLSAVSTESKEQILSDVSVAGGLYDLLNQEGMLDLFLNGAGPESLSEEKITLVLNQLYEFSGAKQLVPDFINLFSATLLGEGTEIIKTENLAWNNTTKDDISEVVRFVFRLSDLLTRKDTMALEEKLAVAEEIKALENNSVINKNILDDFAKSFK